MKRVTFNDVVEVKYFNKYMPPSIHNSKDNTLYTSTRILITLIISLIVLFIISSYIYS